MGVKVKAPPLVEEVRVWTALRLVLTPFWMTMVQPDSQPLYLRVKGSPSVTSNLLLRNLGAWAEARATRAERAAKAYFMLAVWQEW